MLFLGIDAGGTKTQFALCDAEGRVLATHRCEGISLGALGADGMCAALTVNTEHILSMAPGTDRELGAVCFGVPCLGENRQDDETVIALVAEVFSDTQRVLVNDAEVAWAGSFALKPGINLVAGTGTIAFGCDGEGNTARCGGWHHLFSDEGSGYWLGRRTLELFCKQSDGRSTRGPLHAIIRHHFALTDDFDIIPIAENEILPHRDKVAALQLLLLEAARQGDADAIDSYRLAAHEIALNVRGIISRLNFIPPIAVSCSGGIFKVGEILTVPFHAALETAGCVFATPKSPPWCGALMLALKACGLATPPVLEKLMVQSHSIDA